MFHRGSRANRRARLCVAKVSAAARRSVCELLEERQLLSATLNGVVFNDANMNGSQDAAEVGFSGLTVSVADLSGNPIAATTTDSSGNYSITGIPTGQTVNVSVNLPGWVTLNGDGLGGATYGTVSASLPDGSSTLPFAEYRALPAPSSLSAVAASGSEVDLSWTSNSGGGESGFNVYDSINGGPFSSTPVATTATNVTSRAITGLDSANDYVFTVTAFDANGDSYRSGTADAVAPPAPTDVETSALLDMSGNASVEVNWVPGPGTPPGATYNVFRSTDGTIPTTPYATGITGSSFTNASVTAGATYYYFVQSVAGAPLSAGATPSSGAASGPQTAVPTGDGTVVYNRPGSVLAGSAGDGSDDDNFTIVPIHSFDTSLGTQTGGGVQFLWTDSVTFVGDLSAGPGTFSVFWHESNPDGSVIVEAEGDGLDGGDIEGGTGLRQFHTGHGLNTRALPALGAVALEAKDFILGGPDDGIPDSCQVALAGYISTTYTYTTAAPTVTTSPGDQSGAAGTTATFSADASGSPVPSVQWQKSTDGGSTWAPIPGATTTTYSFTVTAADNGSQYEAVFTNSAGTVTSSPATLTVPVAVTAVTVNGGNSALAGSQRSMVDSIVYTFSEPVTLASTGAFTIAVHNGEPGTAPDLSWSAISPDGNGASDQWVVTFGGSSVIGGSIANGVYDITLNTTAVTAEQDPSKSITPRATDTFYRLFGDGNGDQAVNDTDNTLFQEAQSTYNAAFDYNADGIVNNFDDLQLNRDYGTSYQGTFTPTI